MYTPDSYLYETNLTLLASPWDAELTDAELMAQITPGAGILAALGGWLAAACERGLAGLAAAFTYTSAGEEEAEACWYYWPMF